MRDNVTTSLYLYMKSHLPSIHHMVRFESLASAAQYDQERYGMATFPWHPRLGITRLRAASASQEEGQRGDARHSNAEHRW
jgi:hypothetical protein